MFYIIVNVDLLALDAFLLCTGVIVDGKEVDADVVVIALGPWSKNACKWLPLPSISAKKVHSIVLKPTEPLTAHALFMNIRTSNGNLQ